MDFIPEIKLLKGLCSINFGETMDAVKQILGEPEEMQNLADEILGTSSTVLHYWERGFSLFFDNTRNKTFTSVELDNRDSLLFDTEVFSLSEKELIALMKSHNYALSDSETHEWGEKRVSFDEAGMDCYFHNNKLASINFGIIEGDSFYFFPN